MRHNQFPVHSEQTEKFQLNTGQPAAAWRDSYADWDKAVEMAGNRLMLVHSSSSDPSWQNVWGSVRQRLAPLCVEKQAGAAQVFWLLINLHKVEGGQILVRLDANFGIVIGQRNQLPRREMVLCLYVETSAIVWRRGGSLSTVNYAWKRGPRDHALFVMGQQHYQHPLHKEHYPLDTGHSLAGRLWAAKDLTGPQIFCLSTLLRYCSFYSSLHYCLCASILQRALQEKRKQFSHAEVSMKDYQYKIATGARECKEHPAELKNINCNEMAQSRSGGEEAAD